MHRWIRKRRGRLLAGVTVCEACGEACIRACQARRQRELEQFRAVMRMSA